VVALVSLSLFAIALMGGFAMAFVASSKRLKHVVLIVTFGGILSAILALSFANGAIKDPRLLFLAAGGLCGSYIPFFIGRMLGKPFVEIWHEHQNSKLQETFK